MGNTTRFNLPYPEGPDQIGTTRPEGFKDLADALASVMAGWGSGNAADRPTAGTPGRFYYATDTGVLWLDAGSDWVRMGPPELAIPAGVIAPYGGASAPTGWLLCDGSAVSRSTYAALYAAIGSAYGPGDGSTTFNLPDLRGRTAVGAGAGPGLTTRTRGDKLGGETLPSHSHTVAAHTHSFSATTTTAGLHSHGVNDPGHSHGIGIFVASGNAGVQVGSSFAALVYGGYGWATDVRGTGISIQSGGSHNHSVSGTTASAGGGNTGTTGTGSHGVMQPSTVVNYIIKT